jgi:hypothetical protein
LHVGAERAQHRREVLVAAVEVMGAGDHRFALGHQPGQHQRRTAADVGRADLGPRQPAQPAHHCVVPLGADVRAHSPELVDVSEAPLEQVLGHDRDTVGHCEHRDKQRLVVGGHTGVRQCGDVDRPEPAPRSGPQAVRSLVDLDAHRAELADEHLHVVVAAVFHDHLAAGDGHAGHEGAGDDAVGDHRVAPGFQRLDAGDLEARRAGAADRRAHRVEVVGQVAHLGLAGRVLDDGRPLGQRGRHHQIVGRRVARVVEDDPGPDEPGTHPAGLHGPLDEAVTGDEVRPHVREPVYVEVDRPRTEVVTSGHRQPGVATARQQWAEHHDRRPHLVDELIGRFGRKPVGRRDVDDEDISLASDTDAKRAQHVRHDLHVDDVRHVAQLVTPLGEQAGGHQLQRRVLGAPRPHRARKGTVRANDEPVHRPIIARYGRARGETAPGT